jgi:hypothetical protein
MTGARVMALYVYSVSIVCLVNVGQLTELEKRSCRIREIDQ